MYTSEFFVIIDYKLRPQPKGFEKLKTLLPSRVRVKGQCRWRHLWELALLCLHAATKRLYKLELPEMTYRKWLRNRAFRKSLRKALGKGIQNDCFFTQLKSIWLDFLIHWKHFKWNSANFTTWHFRSSRSLIYFISQLLLQFSFLRCFLFLLLTLYI